MYLPEKLPLESETIFTGKEIFDLTSLGVIYARNWNSNMVQKSSDWGETWTNVHQTDSRPRHVKELLSGHVLIAEQTGKVHRSDESGNNFTETLEFETAGATFYQGFGFNVYKNIVLAAEYDVGKFAYLSTDGGNTWEKIKTAVYGHDITQHFHDIQFDPYEELIWYQTGDGGANNQIAYSWDYGGSWEYVKEGLDIRGTGIIPLPNCVIFLSDESAEMNVWTHLRPKLGTSTEALVPRKTFIPNRWANFDGGDPWTGAYVTVYGKNPLAIFGWHQSASNITHPACLYATDNGIDFTSIWSLHKKIQPATDTNMSNRVGIRGVFGPTEDNEILVQVNSQIEGNFYHGIKIQL